jgi:hypothetical protein
MRIARLALFCIYSAAVLTIPPASAQSGGKKHHKNDSTSAATTTTATASTATANTPGAAGPITFKSGVTASSPFFIVGDPTFNSNVTVSSGEIPALESSKVTSIPPFKGDGYKTYYVSWVLIDQRGTAELAFANNGEWWLGGKYTVKQKSTQYYEIAFAVKKKDGQVLLFHFLGAAPRGSYTWGGQSPANIDYQEFNDFRSNGFEVRAAYRVINKKVADEVAKQYPLWRQPCWTPDKLAPGWGVLWSWADPHQSCMQYDFR